MKKIMLLAGEISGDSHAARLVTAIKKAQPDADVFGMGGSRLAKAGCRIVQDIDGMSVIGLVEVIKKYGFFKRIFDRLIKTALTEKPDVIVLVDYPGFNIRFAKKIKKLLNVKIVYFIAPQLWAWGRNRAAVLRQLVDLMIVVLPFEKEFFEKEGIRRVEFCGHPIRGYLPLEKDRNTLRSEIGCGAEDFAVTLLPGSRKNEVKNFLPVMLEALGLCAGKIPGLKVYLGCAGKVVERLIEQIVDKSHIDIEVIDSAVYEHVSASDLVLVSSGTATLETGLMAIPMVIVYRVKFFTWLVARMLIRVKFIGLINILHNKKVVPELVQFDATPARVARQVLDFYNHPENLEQIRGELLRTKQILGDSEPENRAAKLILEL